MKAVRDLSALYEGEPEVSLPKRSSTPTLRAIGSTEVPRGTFTPADPFLGGSATAGGSSDGGPATAGGPAVTTASLRKEIEKLRAEIESGKEKAEIQRAHIESAFSGLSDDHASLKSELQHRGEELVHSEGLRIATVQHASQQLQGCMDRVSELEGYNEALSEQLRTANANFTTVQLERARLQHEISQMQSLNGIALEKCRHELAVSKADGGPMERGPR